MADEDKRVLKDGGKRQEFPTGAVRDTQDGKGRYDLMPMNTLYELVINPSYWLIPNEMDKDPSPYLRRALIQTIEAMVNPDVAETFALRAGSEMLNYMEIIFRKSQDQGGRVLPGLPIHGLFRVARVYEKGAIKYTPRNWEKGINLTRFLDSAFRHMFQTAAGMVDEDHPAQAAWNLLSFVETKKWIDTGVLPKTLNDLPVKISQSPELQEAMKNPGVADVMKVFTGTSGMTPVPGKPGAYRMPDGSEVSVTMQ